MKRSLTMLLSLNALIAAPIAFASDGAQHTADLSSLAWPAFNFTVYVSLMFFALKGPLSRALAARHEAVRGAVEHGKQRTVEAQKILVDAQAQTRNVDADMAEISRKIEQEGKAEVASIIAGAKTRAERIVAQARESAIAEQKATESILKQELAQLVLKLAREKLERGVTAESDKALRQRALTNVSAVKLN